MWGLVLVTFAVHQRVHAYAIQMVFEWLQMVTKSHELSQMVTVARYRTIPNGHGTVRTGYDTATTGILDAFIDITRD